MGSRNVLHPRCARVLGGGRALLLCALLSLPVFAEEAKPDKPKLSDEVEKAFNAFVKSAKDSRTSIAKGDLTKLCDEVAKSVKLTDDQRKKLETEATPAIAESCDKFAEKLDAWLRPFLVGYGDRGLTNLGRWKPDQFASRPNVSASPQDSKAWEEAVKKVLSPDQLVVYQLELGDKTARRKKEIANYLKDALSTRRTQLADSFKLEREGLVRELGLDKERTAKLAAAETSAIDGILAEDEKTATEQLLALNEESWKQMYGAGGVHQFDSSGSKSQVTKRESWKKALGTVLTPEELKRWEGTLGRRQERRERAASMGAVAELEDKVLLSADQRPKLEKIFLERWKRYPNNENNQIYPMNLLRGGSDSEISSLLSKEQKKRWDEFVKNGYGNNRNLNEAPPPKAAPAKPAEPPQPVDTERVFAAYFVKYYHDQRDRMMSAMQEHVDELVRVTSLSGEPLKMVQVAAKGAVERVLDASWKTSVDQSARSSVEGVGAQFLKQRLDAMGENRYSIEPPEQNVLWTQTLKSSLTEEQLKTYETVRLERDAYRDRAIVQIILAQLDVTLRISGDQGDKLEPLLAGVVKEYWPDYQRSFSGNSYAIYPYYLPVMLSGVPDKDRKEILTAEQLKQFDNDGQNRYNGWWENMKRYHDQRLKKK